jgi:hypothetical protein
MYVAAQAAIACARADPARVADTALTRTANAARSEPPSPAWEAEVDRLDALRRWQLVQNRADDPLNVVLVVPEVD